MINLSRMYRPNCSNVAVVPATSTAYDAQPRGYDQWANMYDAYCVLSCRVKIQVLFVDQAIACSELIARLDDNAMYPTGPPWNDSPNKLKEKRIPHRRLLMRTLSADDPLSTGPSAQGLFSGKDTMYLNYKLKKMFRPGRGDVIEYQPNMGVSDAILTSGQLSAYQTLANPIGSIPSIGKECVLKIYNYAYSAATTTEGTAGIEPKIRVSLEYIALMTNPKQVNASEV